MKKFFVLFLAIVMCFSLFACGSEETTELKTNNDIDIQNDTTNSPALTNPVVETNPVLETNTVVENEPVVTYEQISVGDTITTDFVKMKFTEAGIEKDIRQSITIDIVTRITGPQPIEGQQFVYLRGTIKNLAKEELPVYDFFLGEFDIDGYKYEISANECDIITVNGESEFTIPPLAEYTFTMYAAIPDELANANNTINFRFGFYDMFDNMELSKNRTFEEDPISFCKYLYHVTVK